MAAGLVKKLQIREGQGVAVMFVPEGYRPTLVAALDGATITDAQQPDAVIAFVTTRADSVPRATGAFERVAPGGLVWIAYPKKTGGVATDTNRGILWADLGSTGWRPVRQVAIDDTWSAIRFRPQAEVQR